MCNVSRIYSRSIRSTDIDILFSTEWLNSSGCYYVRSCLFSSNKSWELFCIIFYSKTINTFDKPHSRSWYITVLSTIFNNFLHIISTFGVNGSFNNIELRCIYFIKIASKSVIFAIIINISCVYITFKIIHIFKSDICFMFNRSNNH